jgi:hypothetical protein
MGSSFNTADFTSAMFDKEASFDDTQFNGTTIFNNSRFKDDALFENTIFRDVLYLTRAKYDKFYIRWASINEQGKLGYDDTAYLLLIKNFKNIGFFEDAYDCYYQYRIAHLQKVWGPYRIFDVAALGLYGYGVKPLYPLIWAIILILLFWPIYLALNLDMTPGEAFKFSFIVLLSGAGPFLSISSDLSKAGKYKKLAFAEKILGSILFALFLIALSKTIIGEIV